MLTFKPILEYIPIAKKIVLRQQKDILLNGLAALWGTGYQLYPSSVGNEMQHTANMPAVAVPKSNDIGDGEGRP